jgi:transposase-like protein
MLTCVRWDVAQLLSDRQIEEMMQERRVSVDHATINSDQMLQLRLG